MVVCQVSCQFGPAFEELTGISQQALSRSQQAVEQAERSGDFKSRTTAQQHLGWAQLMHGHVADALDTLQHVGQLMQERVPADIGLNLTHGLLAEAHLAAGDAANARTVANRCMSERKGRVYDLRAHLSRSRVLRALDGADAQGEIEASLERAQLLLEKSGARAFAPFIIEERARLAEVLGDTEGATQHLREAQRAFTEVEATGHAERLKRELGA
jgi:hypothetical protein